ncbi:MAG: N-acetyltransferase [Desulfobacterales bacterium]
MIRKATIKDIKSIHKILADYGRKGVMLPRPLSELYDHVRDFLIFENPETKKIIGCCALQFCWEDLAEIRSLAVLPDHTKKRIGSRLMETALEEARLFNIKNVFTLTYKPDFFKQFGFDVVDRATLPLKIWADCYMCVKFPDCDETAMMKAL